MGVRLAALPLLIALIAGCAEGHCRRQADSPKAPQPLPAPVESADTPSDQDQVFVYKYDGSVQCGGGGKPVAVETMAKELQGIPIKSMLKKSDGQMHIQVCGAITGKANVYEIPAKFLKAAESKGFKKWTFE